jgi:uncharacterized protein with NRDE domain
MCLATIIKFNQYPKIIISRDEFKSRKKESGFYSDSEIAYPIDGQCGGTWVGVNYKHEYAAFLQNKGKFSQDKKYSRGDIIKAYIELDFNSFLKKLSLTSLNNFNGFSLTLVSINEIITAEYEFSLKFSYEDRYLITNREEYNKNIYSYEDHLNNVVNSEKKETKSICVIDFINGVSFSYNNLK